MSILIKETIEPKQIIASLEAIKGLCIVVICASTRRAADIIKPCFIESSEKRNAVKTVSFTSAVYKNGSRLYYTSNPEEMRGVNAHILVYVEQPTEEEFNYSARPFLCRNGPSDIIYPKGVFVLNDSNQTVRKSD